jgi:anti-sigma B factor antagonist
MALRRRLDRTVGHDRHRQATTEAADFRVDVVHEPGGVRIRPVGEIDMATIGVLRSRIDEARAAAVDRVILDLRATTFLDSSGLHLIVETETWARSNDTVFAIVAGPADVQHTFDVAGVTGRLPFVDGSQFLLSAAI